MSFSCWRSPFSSKYFFSKFSIWEFLLNYQMKCMYHFCWTFLRNLEISKVTSRHVIVNFQLKFYFWYVYIAKYPSFFRTGIFLIFTVAMWLKFFFNWAFTSYCKKRFKELSFKVSRYYGRHVVNFFLRQLKLCIKNFKPTALSNNVSLGLQSFYLTKKKKLKKTHSCTGLPFWTFKRSIFHKKI